MDLYNALKPALLFFVAFLTAGRALAHFGKNDIKGIWVVILLGVAIFYFVNDPQGFLSSGNGLMNAVKSWFATLGFVDLQIHSASNIVPMVATKVAQMPLQLVA